MKILLLVLAITGTAFSHKFFAENNYICNICKEGLRLQQEGNDEQAELLLQPFDEAIKKITAGVEDLDLEGKTIQEQCEMVNMCGDEDFEDWVIDHAAIIDEVNSDPTSSWFAAPNARFMKTMASDVRKTLGTIVDPDWVLPLPELYEDPNTDYSDVPATFDSRTNWPKCTELGMVRDQANCGSCWAFGTTEAFNDRRCIMAGGSGNVNTLLSTADTTGCCSGINCGFSNGCDGGQIGQPWNWFHSTGVVTGASFGDKATCYPYTMPMCEHHVPGSKPNCEKVKRVNPTCSHTCTGNTQLKYTADKVKATHAGYSPRSKEQLMADIAKNGPVTGAFIVYEDFLTYKSGVYQHKTGRELGGHAIKVIGWGTEDDLDYWLVMNSWNEDWGDKGLFKIVQSEIDQFAAGASPRTLEMSFIESF